MKMINGYEMVIGLEVHVELATKTKIFCDCPTAFGAEPNTNCCPVCTGMPGTLPVVNKKVIEYAVKAGLATNCKIANFSKQDRKNYFYPDLPKAYQISQYDLPLCEHGWLDIETKDGAKRIGITRIHIEEDAGKLVHSETHGTMIDCNRCGVPLIEIVSEPDIRSAEEAVTYLKKLRAIIIYTGVSECKMQEGAMRCDVNLSVRKEGEPFGVRTEMKNLNSFQFIAKAIEYEYKRQVEALEAGEMIVQETRRFDSDSGKTYSMRKKEDANDYRYFPDPDLAPIVTKDERIEAIRRSIPELPDSRKARYVEKYGLTPYDAELITTDKRIADYFEAAAAKTAYQKILANLLIGELMKYASDEGEIALEPEKFAAVAEMSGGGEINSSTAKKILKEAVENDVEPYAYAAENNLKQINDRAEIKRIAREVIAANPKSAADFKAGKQAALGAIIGQVMGRTGGRANPVLADEVCREALAE